jgi:hypothetical protein
MKKLMKSIRKRKNEKGVALFIALFALLLLASIGMGMLFMANTETAVNYNYRDAQRTYFASQAGLELVREAMRNPLTGDNLIPQTLPGPGNPTGVLYILNPLPGESVRPWLPGNTYFDDELCHEYDNELGMGDPNAVHVALPCTVGPPAGSYTDVTASVTPPIPYAGTDNAFSFKWVRITLKANKSTPYKVDLSQPDTSQVCWDDEDFRQHILNVTDAAPGEPRRRPTEFELAAFKQALGMSLETNAVFAFGAKGKSTTTGSTTTGSTTTGSTTTGSTTTGSTTTGSTTTGSTTTGSTTTGSTTTGSTTGTTTGGYFSNDACQMSAHPLRFSVYLLTSLAVSPTGSRRLSQFEISRYPAPPIPGGLTFNGPGANFLPADSNNFMIDGHDHAVAGPRCSGPRSAIHAVTANGAAARSTLITQVQDDGRPDHYLGVGNDEQTNAGPPAQDFAGQQYDYSTTPPTPTQMLPDIADGTVVDTLHPDYDPATSKPVLDKFDTVEENEKIVSQFTENADTLATGDVNGAGSLPLKNPECNTNDWQMGTDPLDMSVPLACRGEKNTVVQGDFSVSNTRGYGVLLVTGTLTISGNFEWNGLILVIGDGKIVANGGGNRTINGGIYLAQTKDPSTGAPLAALGSPFVDWNGGGTNELRYDSCKIKNAYGKSAFRVIAYRELTY